MDTARRPLRILFRVAAGPRVGFGHLVRAVSLSEALGVPARLSVRGSHPSIARTARRLGATLVRGHAPMQVLARMHPDVLVIDDRVARETASWRRAGRRLRIPIVGVHDLGIGLGDANLVVDGSIGASGRLRRVPALLGPRYAILNPRTVDARETAVRDGAGADVVVALGGGPRRSMGLALARAVVARRPGTRVGIAGGFVTEDRGPGPESSACWVKPADLGAALATARVAVVAGGVTLYECLAIGVPSVAVAVVPSQRTTVAAFARLGAVADGSATGARASAPRAIDRLAGMVADLLEDSARCAALRSEGRRLVDGRGAARVADAIEQLARAAGAPRVGTP
jgi:spore coat polysaccharide biosynthesis predicted glycosyltransferase SpsG